MAYNNSQSQYGYGNYPEGFPSGYSGYGYGGQASTTPVLTPVATQPATVTATQTYGQYHQAQAGQSAAQTAARPAGQANQLLGLLAAAARPAQPGSYPGYPSSSQANYSGYSRQNTNYPLPTQSSRPGGQIIKRSANDNYRASLAPGKNSTPGGGYSNSRENSNNAPLESVKNHSQKRGLGSGESNYCSGGRSSRSFGDDFGPKKPRFSSYENWGKDDDLIKVEPTLIDKKFNFWNLPKSARILLVRYYPYIT
jgi:hypothetical protein